MPSTSFSDHVSNVFSTAVDLNHLFHPYKEIDPDDAPPTLANRIGAVCLLVLSLATLGILTGFYFYRADKKVVHLEKAEGRDAIISHLYQQRGPGTNENQTQIESRNALMKGVVVSRQEVLSSLNEHQKTVVKAAVALDRGNTKKALARVKALGAEEAEDNSLTPEEKRELLQVAIAGGRVSVVFDLIEAFSAQEKPVEKLEEAVEIADSKEAKETKEAKKWEELFQIEFPWNEIKNEKMFEALWEKAKVNQEKLTLEGKQAILSLVLKNKWEEKTEAVLTAFSTDLERGDAPWDQVDSVEIFDKLWAKLGDKKGLEQSKKDAIFRCVVKNDVVDKANSIWAELGGVNLPWDEVKSEALFDVLWTGLGKNVKTLDQSQKNAIFTAVVRNNWVEKVTPVWTDLGGVNLPWNEVQSPEMLHKLRGDAPVTTAFKTSFEKNNWNYLLHTAKTVEIAKAFKEKGGESLVFNRMSALHTCKDPEIAKYLISEDGFKISVDYRYGNSDPVPLFTTPKEVQKVLIEKEADVNIPHSDGYTLLHVTDDPEMMKLLIEHGADINAKDAEGKTPLADLTNPKILKLLAKAKDADGNTLLHKCEDLELAKRLIAHGGDIEAKNKNGSTPLLTVGSFEIEKLLLSKGANVNAQSNRGWTLLMNKCQGYGGIPEQLEEIAFLLENGANPNLKNVNTGETVLHDIVSDRLDLFELLVQKGADKYAESESGLTPFFNAVFCDDRSLMDKLLELGVDPQKANSKGQTALFYLYSAPENLDSITSLLIDEKGLNVNAQDREGNTALHGAREKKIAETLIAKGADPRLLNRAGQSPLFTTQRKVVANYFIDELGLDRNLKDSSGRTPLHTCPSHMVSYWQDKGLNINEQDNEGKTPLHYCTDRQKAAYLIKAGANPAILDNQGKQAPIYVEHPDWFT